jgi:aspartate carbamoyltransferase catalytic subunit
MSTHFDGWPHVIESQQFSREWLEQVLFPTAQEMRSVFEKGGTDILHGKRMIVLFYQPSTRTRGSFQMAMSNLGGEATVVTENAKEFSSAFKNESLKHTIKVWNRYRPNIIVMRHHEEGAAAIAAQISRVPIMNAGDGPGQHPTQGWLDWFTVFERFGRIDGLNIGIMGDLRKGRAARSFVYILSRYPKVKLYLISSNGSRMRTDVKSHLTEHSIWFAEGNDVNLVAPELDVLYVTRDQKEQVASNNAGQPQENCNGVVRPFISWEDYVVVDEKVLNRMKKDAIVLHPLPIDSEVQEIRQSVEKDSRIVCFEDQIDAGLLTRMAALKLILAPTA